MKLSCKFRYPVALSRLLTEFRTRMSVVGVLLFCRTCHERKSKLPSKMATAWVDGITVRLPSVSIVVMPPLLQDLNPYGALRL